MLDLRLGLPVSDWCAGGRVFVCFGVRMYYFTLRDRDREIGCRAGEEGVFLGISPR